MEREGEIEKKNRRKKETEEMMTKRGRRRKREREEKEMGERGPRPLKKSDLIGFMGHTDTHEEAEWDCPLFFFLCCPT